MNMNNKMLYRSVLIMMTSLQHIDAMEDIVEVDYTQDHTFTHHTLGSQNGWFKQKLIRESSDTLKALQLRNIMDRMELKPTDVMTLYASKNTEKLGNIEYISLLGYGNINADSFEFTTTMSIIDTDTKQAFYAFDIDTFTDIANISVNYTTVDSGTDTFGSTVEAMLGIPVRSALLGVSFIHTSNDTDITDNQNIFKFSALRALEASSFITFTPSVHLITMNASKAELALDGFSLTAEFDVHNDVSQNMNTHAHVSYTSLKNEQDIVEKTYDMIVQSSFYFSEYNYAELKYSNSKVYRDSTLYENEINKGTIFHFMGCEIFSKTSQYEDQTNARTEKKTTFGLNIEYRVGESIGMGLGVMKEIISHNNIDISKTEIFNGTASYYF